jgi:hypothetical protein
MTNQTEITIYNIVRNHLLTQMVQSISGPQKACKYRGDKGCKCAIGVLIKDEFYSDTLEGCSSNSEKVQKALKNSGYNFDECSLGFLSELQFIHDLHDPNKWKELLDNFAATHNIITTPVSGIPELFHKLWGEAHDSPQYNKQNWLKMQLLLRNNGIKV